MRIPWHIGRWARRMSTPRPRYPSQSQRGQALAGFGMAVGGIIGINLMINLMIIRLITPPPAIAQIRPVPAPETPRSPDANPAVKPAATDSNAAPLTLNTYDIRKLIDRAIGATPADIATQFQREGFERGESAVEGLYVVEPWHHPSDRLTLNVLYRDGRATSIESYLYPAATNLPDAPWQPVNPDPADPPGLFPESPDPSLNDGTETAQAPGSPMGMSSTEAASYLQRLGFVLLRQQDVGNYRLERWYREANALTVDVQYEDDRVVNASLIPSDAPPSDAPPSDAPPNAAPTSRPDSPAPDS